MTSCITVAGNLHPVNVAGSVAGNLYLVSVSGTLGGNPHTVNVSGSPTGNLYLVSVSGALPANLYRVNVSGTPCRESLSRKRFWYIPLRARACARVRVRAFATPQNDFEVHSNISTFDPR